MSILFDQRVFFVLVNRPEVHLMITSSEFPHNRRDRCMSTPCYAAHCVCNIIMANDTIFDASANCSDNSTASPKAGQSQLLDRLEATVGVLSKFHCL